MAYIGLGANLGEREAMLREAVDRLTAIGDVRAVSSLYETEPVGYADQPTFLNAAAALETTLSPDALVRRLLAIERDLGRVRTFRNAPRTLDLDLLLLDDLVSAAPGATVPHPRMHERAFVLVPLAEIAPAVLHPTLHRSIAELANALPARSGVRHFAYPGWERGDSSEGGIETSNAR
jgi:2-amino-4-hydroxy-6-hydroxymethyldihydropteridine diphosphokinase